MAKSDLNASKGDLATRVFKSFYFGIIWLVFLAFTVRLVWPLRNALLVIWVYGRAAYFEQGIRVLAGKPVKFSTGSEAPAWPDLATGFAVFIVTVLGLSLLLFYALRFYENIITRRKP